MVPIRVPALRERGSADVEMLAHHFARKYGQRHGRPHQRLGAAALRRLVAHDWPGNVRELENCIESATVLADTDEIGAGDLPLPERTRGRPGGPDLARLTWSEMEQRYIDAVLAAHDGNRSAAARAMGIGRSTLLRKLRDRGR